MENMTLENKEEYERFIKDISTYAIKAEFTVLAKDRTPKHRFIEYLEMSVSDLVDRTHHKGSKKKGIHGSMVYKLVFNDELLALLFSFENIFTLETRIIDENNNRRVFKSKVIPTEFGFTDLSFMMLQILGSFTQLLMKEN